MSLRVLILGGHCNAALEAAQSLGRRGACITLASEDPDCLAFGSRYVAERLVQPTAVWGADAANWLRDWDRRRAYHLIVPSNDSSLELVRALAEDEPARAKAIVPDNASLDVALDKHATWTLARRLGVPAPESTLIPQGGPAPECVRFPVVLKSTRSRVRMGLRNTRVFARVVSTPEARAQVLSRWLRHVAVQQQEFVPGSGFGIEMLFDRGRPVWHFAHQRIHEFPLTGGGSTYRRSIAAPPEALRIAELLLRELRWHGVAMVEFRGAPSGPFHLMEINPRLWGSLALSVDCGVDFPWGLALLARGEALPPQSGYRIGYHTRDLYRDFLWHLENARADRSDPLLLTRPPLRALRELARPLAGHESWDHFDWKDLGVTIAVFRRLYRYQAGMLASLARRQWRKLEALLHHRRVIKAAETRGRPRRMLFLCYGNICRSPVAEELASRRLAGVEVESAGFHPEAGRESPAHVQRAARAAGLDVARHRSRRVRPVDVQRADLVLCMDIENLRVARERFPDAAGRTTLLGLLARPGRVRIADPYSLSERETAEVIATIDAGVRGLSAWMETLPGYGGREAPG